jgi:cytidylate kinase
MSVSGANQNAGDVAAPVVTIDGPVGSGKGTVSSRLAARLGWHLLDSGALYRLVALSALQCNVADDDRAGLADVAQTLDCSFEFDGAQTRIKLFGNDVTEAVRTEDVSRMASVVAAVPEVRASLVTRQKAFRRWPGLVADGRDMGTVIFPDAVAKLFLTATTRARAERRYKQLKEKGESVNLPRLLQDLEARDKRDASREISPLEPAGDATIIDSTNLGIDEVVDKAYNIIEKKLLSI